jgi:hypothetical protein
VKDGQRAEVCVVGEDDALLRYGKTQEIDNGTTLKAAFDRTEYVAPKLPQERDNIGIDVLVCQ